MEEDAASPGHSNFAPYENGKPSGLALEKENYVIKHAEEKLNSEVKTIAHSSSSLSKRWDNCKRKQLLWERSARCKQS